MRALAARITSLLGTGPEGARYLGEAPDGRPVLLHALRVPALSAERRTELEERAALLRATSSLEVWPVLDAKFGPERGLLVVAIEATPTLAERLAAGPLPPERAAALALGLLRAVRRAHRIGLVHGALAPSQIWTRDDGSIVLDLTGVATAPVPDQPHPAQDSGFEADVAATAALVDMLLAGQAQAVGTRAMLTAMRHPDLEQRPTIGESLRALAPALVHTATSTSGERPRVVPEPGTMLGRYRLTHRLGRGANGEVFRAEQLGADTPVAIKVLKADAMLDDVKLRRFRREARMLAQIRHPHIANLIEVNEDGGVMFLVMELVEGPSLDHHRKTKGPMAERDAVWVVHHVAAGLAVAHERGIVHRDVKPANILLGPKTDPRPDGAPFHARLCDFGVARWRDSNDASLTQGFVVGTPRYMAPEQCTGLAPVTPAADVYALGLVLFEILTGEPPYTPGASTLDIMRAHVEEAPKRADTLRPDLSPGVVSLIARCLSKEPAERPADGGALADLLRGLLTPPTVDEHHGHPEPISTHDPDVLEAVHEWVLPAPPAALWRYVSDTERLNRAIGLPAVEWSVTDEPGGELALFGEASQAGVRARWRERPFEWIEGQRLGVVREYEQGPLIWYVSAVELAPHESGGTALTHRLWLKPRGRVWRSVVWMEAKQRLRAKLDRVYPRLAEVALAPEGVTGDDPFEGAHEPKKAERRRLDTLVGKLVSSGATPAAADALARVLATWPDQAVARLRPKVLARRFGLSVGELVDACLLGGSVGLLVPLWDVICPTCRIPTRILDSLSAVQSHMSCETCRLAFAVDVASSIELVFRAHPDVRSAEGRTYCIGGPAHSPHVVLQLRLAPGEQHRFCVHLEDGRYELRTTRDAWRSTFRVARGLGPRRAELVLTEEGLPPLLPVLGGAPQSFVVVNQCARERVFRLERAVLRDDAFTAAEAATHPMFQRLYPQQTFGPNTLVGLAAITLLITDLHASTTLYAQRGDAAMLGALHRHIDGLEHIVAESHGTVVKSAGHGLVAAFARTEDAVRAGLAVITAAQADKLPVMAAVHHGPAMVATVGGRIDYFGRVVVRTHNLLGRAAAGQLVLSERVAEDPSTEALWRERGCEAEVLTAAVEPGVQELAVRVRRRA